MSGNQPYTDIDQRESTKTTNFICEIMQVQLNMFYLCIQSNNSMTIKLKLKYYVRCKQNRKTTTPQSFQ